jgi:hypothetical protein
MKTYVSRWATWAGVMTAFMLAAACSDVGDSSSAGGGADGSEPDVVGSDGTMGAPGDDASDAQTGEAASDASAVMQAGDDADATLGEPDAPANTESDAGSDGGTPEAGEPDAAAEAGAPDAAQEAGEPDAAQEAGEPDAAKDAGLDATLIDAGTGADAGAPEGGSQDSGGADTGTGHSLPVPCTTAGQTNCVECDQNTDHLCTPTEAILLTRDIEKGLYSGNLPAPTVSMTGGSCYECLAVNDCVDSTAMGFTGLECGDLVAASAVQPCLDTLNCVLGSPQAGTAGATGTPNPAVTSVSLAADCTNAGDGVFNCFCGSNDMNTTVCGAAPTVAVAQATSPNGACQTQVFAGTGTTSSTANSTIIGDLSNVNLGAGLAFSIPICAGSNQNAGQACPQCYQ